MGLGNTSLPSVNGSATQLAPDNLIEQTRLSRATKCALAIASVFCFILVVSLASLLACAVVHPAIYIGFALAVVLFFVVFGTIILHFLRSDKKPVLPISEPTKIKLPPSLIPIPEGFLRVVKEKFPSVIYDLCVSQLLTISQLRSVLEGIKENDFTSMSADVNKKLEAFGVRNLQRECQGVDLPTLDEVLMQNCPFFFLKSFIDQGPREIPEAEGMSPETYWTSCAGLLQEGDILFDEGSWIFAHVVFREEYEQLVHHAREGSWHEVSIGDQALVEQIKSRIEASVNELSKRQQLLALQVVYNPLRLQSLCMHGMSWEQMLILRGVGISCCGFLMECEIKGECLPKLARTMSVIYPHLNETSPNYDPDTALLTWKEWQAGLGTHESTEEGNCHEATLDLLNSRSRRGICLQPVSGIDAKMLAHPRYQMLNEKRSKM
ncbi:DUF1389 domain-containing protein [Chlamydia vaughanii]|uniref:DUF1389 domain-containing protein n=1 Tax=Chlamydia vaughanii TaxID=3112552 RepID=UPI0032B178DD